MTLRALLPAALAALAVFAPAQADARSVCGPRDQIVRRLAESYGEMRQSYGLQNARLMVEIYVSPETGTFTILATRPEGQACVLAVGRDWRDDPATLADPPA